MIFGAGGRHHIGSLVMAGWRGNGYNESPAEITESDLAVSGEQRISLSFAKADVDGGLLSGS